MLKKYMFLVQYYVFNLIFNKFARKFLNVSNKSNLNFLERLRCQFKTLDSDTILIVGNGPSLKAEDLDKCIGLPSIASNKISLIFEDTEWRPDLITVCDPLLSYKERYNLPAASIPFLSSDSVHKIFRKKSENRGFWKSIPFDEAYSGFKPDPVNSGLFEGYTITVQNLQLAIWLGFKNIILLGVDHSYSERAVDTPGAKLIHDGANHFHKDYRQKGEIVNNAPIHMMERAYELLYDISKRHGVAIYNATEGSKLRVFPLRSLTELI